MSASFIPLLAIQQRSRSLIYALPAKELRSTSEILAVSREARERLRGVVLALPKPKSTLNVVPWPETPGTQPAAPELVGSVPLDMLAQCSWKFLVKLAALKHGQTTKDILGHSRTAPVVKARHQAIYLVAAHTVYSATRIGNKFGRDHATVLAALKKFPPIERERLQPIAHVQAISTGITTPERAAIIVQGFADGVPRKVIAEQIGMSLASVKGFAYRHGLKHAKRPYYVRKSVSEAQE